MTYNYENELFTLTSLLFILINLVILISTYKTTVLKKIN